MVVTVVPSTVVLAATIFEVVVLPTFAGAAPLSNFAEVVANDAAALADAGMPFPADSAGSVSLAVARIVPGRPCWVRDTAPGRPCWDTVPGRPCWDTGIVGYSGRH